MAEVRGASRAASRDGRLSRGTSVGSAFGARGGEPEHGYGGPQVCQLVGISYRQLDYWARTGLLRPSLAEARGSGTTRRYSYRDLVGLKVIKRLLDAGVSLRSARRAVSCLRDELGSDLASANVVLSDTTSVLARSNGELVDLLAGGQCVFNVVPLSGVLDELAADVVAIERDGGSPQRRVLAAAGAGE
ncbi:MAG: MerR family transcriptional regulator [Acidimicrobiales bacterium]